MKIRKPLVVLAAASTVVLASQGTALAQSGVYGGNTCGGTGYNLQGQTNSQGWVWHELSCWQNMTADHVKSRNPWEMHVAYKNGTAWQGCVKANYMVTLNPLTMKGWTAWTTNSCGII